MIEGKIIKFYREKAGLTLEQLSEGICSISHLSRVENGIYNSKGIIFHLSNRLGISIEDEIKRYSNLQEKLHRWYKTLILQHFVESDQLKMELEEETLVEMQDFRVYYQLISVRNFLSSHKIEQVDSIKSAHKIIRSLKKMESSLSPHDQNMLKHVQGMYLYATGNYKGCLNMLKSINQNLYKYDEFYYYLAIAYLQIQAYVSAYYYAQKALEYFQKTINVKRMIDTELLILGLLNSKGSFDSQEVKERYEELILISESNQYDSRTAILYNNLAFEYYRRKKYIEAEEYFQKALNLLNEKTPNYLEILDGLISSQVKGNLHSYEKIEKLANKGLKIARSIQSDFWVSFQLHLYQLNHETDKYNQLIETTFLPLLKKNGNKKLINHYEKKLFQYYSQKNKKQKALEYASSFING
jgi:HTH-type transcriptional regulator, quorum sensing regulator NprR